MVPKIYRADTGKSFVYHYKYDNHGRPIERTCSSNNDHETYEYGQKGNLTSYTINGHHTSITLTYIDQGALWRRNADHYEWIYSSLYAGGRPVSLYSFHYRWHDKGKWNDKPQIDFKTEWIEFLYLIFISPPPSASPRREVFCIHPLKKICTKSGICCTFVIVICYNIKWYDVHPKKGSDYLWR